MTQRFAVVVSSHGEVDEPSVKAYYQNMKHIFAHVTEVMPIPKPAQVLIQLLGSVIQNIKTKREGFKSPMNRISKEQSELIAEVLSKETYDGFEFQVINAYETTPPYTESVIESLKGYDGVIVMPMNPIDSAFTCEAMCRFGAAHYKENAYHQFRVVNGLWKDAELIDVYTNHILKHAEKLNLKKGEFNTLILAMHGTVIANAKGVPVTFRNGAEENAFLYSNLRDALVKDQRNPFQEIKVAYLNHEVGGKWTEPTLAQTIDEIKRSKAKKVAMFAAGYYADNSETAFGAKLKLDRAGLELTHHIPCVNDSKEFASLMAKHVVKHAKGLSARKAIK